MKSIYLFITIILLLGITSGCEKESEGWSTSKITYYVTFDFDLAEGADQLGNQKIVLSKGESYDVTSNFEAKEGDTDVKDKTEITGTVDSNTPGYYVINYSAVNSDGYSASASLGVVVGDPDITTDISGDYISDVDRTPEYYGPFTGLSASITKVAPGIFYMNRMLGNYYFEGAGLSAFGKLFSHGFVRLNANNTISYLDSFSPYWQTTSPFVEDGTYDPETGVIEYTAIFLGRYFHVVLTPNS